MTGFDISVDSAIFRSTSKHAWRSSTNWISPGSREGEESGERREERGGSGGGGKWGEEGREGRKWGGRREERVCQRSQPGNNKVSKGRQGTFTLLDVVVVDEGFAKVCKTGELGFGGGCSQQLFG